MSFWTGPLSVSYPPAAVAVSSGVSQPTLIQHIAAAASPTAYVGNTGDNWKLRLPNAVLANNSLLLGLAYNSSFNVSISDNINGSWSSSPVVTADAGAGNYKSQIFTFPNAKAGSYTITCTFGTSQVQPFNYAISEFAGISSATDGFSGAASQVSTGSSVSCGSFTTTANGDLIWSYFAVAGGAAGNSSTWTSPSPFQLLDADNAWTGGQGFPKASQYGIQSSAGAINPGITPHGDTVNGYNCVSVALKYANAGTLPSTSIRVKKIISHSFQTAPPSPWNLQIPADGNLHVISNTLNFATGYGISSATDSEGFAWTIRSPDASNLTPQFYEAAGRSSNSNLSVTLSSTTTTSKTTIVFWDIVNASSAPFDTDAFNKINDVGGQTTVDNHPSISPNNANGVVLDAFAIGIGPVLGFDVGAPSGASFLPDTFTGQMDVDLEWNSDGYAFYYNKSSAQINWNWAISLQSSNSGDTAYATSVAYKSA